MKNTLTSLLTLALLGGGVSYAQHIDFNQGHPVNIRAYDAWEKAPIRTGQLEGNVGLTTTFPTPKATQLPDNPMTPSGKVAALQRSRYGSHLFGLRVDLDQPLALTEKGQYLHVMIHKPVSGRSVLLALGKRRDRPGQSTEVIQVETLPLRTHTEANQWQEEVFLFKGNPGVDIYSWVIVPDAESPHRLQEDFVAYVDNIVINDSPAMLSENSYYPVNFDTEQKYTRNDRRLKGIQFKVQGEPTTQRLTVYAQPSDQDKVYAPMVDHQFQVKAGQRVKADMDYLGTWMNGFVYIDYNTDGKFTPERTASGAVTPQSELVTYSHIEGKNSLGETLNNGNTKDMPIFTIPAETAPGFYRMRYKMDWSNADPAGNPSSNNSIIQNGGGIVDVRLNVHLDEVKAQQINRNGEVTLADGTPIDNTTLPFGKAFKVRLVPSKGFVANGLKIRHGYHLEGEAMRYDTPQYEDVEIPAGDIGADGTFVVPAQYVDGDLLLEGVFAEDKGQHIARNYYPISFSKKEVRKNKGRNVSQVSLNGTTAQLKNADLLYHRTTYCFTAAPGEEVRPAIGYPGSWMNAYVYLDLNRNGRFDVQQPTLKNGQLDMGESNELVAFSALNMGSKALNSAGQEVPSNLNYWTLPSFVVPDTLQEGYYMMRYKMDWNHVDPAGNNVVENSGAIIDVRLHVTSDKTAQVKVKNQNGSLLYVTGKGETGVSVLENQTMPAGTSLSILSQPDKGYQLSAVYVKHGKLDADPTQRPIEEVASDTILLPVHAGGLCTIDGGDIEGEVEIEPLFSPIAENDPDHFYYEMVFNDEFNQPDQSLPNPKKWKSHPRWGSTWNRFISDKPEVAHIEDNALLCRAIPNPDKSSDKADMLTGAITTWGKYAFKYGRIDVRLKTNLHQGNFPAAWLMPTNQKAGWPACGEIDIFEAINAENKAYHTVHSNWTYTLGHRNDPYRSSGNEPVDVQQYHVYGLDWSPTELNWYVDNKLVHTYKKSTEQQQLEQGQWPFDKDFYIILNQSVGDGGWAAKPDLTFTYDTYFDYVRVYKKTPNHPTGIEQVTTVSARPVIYNLNGQKVTHPGKGVYIVNGEKRIFP